MSDHGGTEPNNQFTTAVSLSLVERELVQGLCGTMVDPTVQALIPRHLVLGIYYSGFITDHLRWELAEHFHQ